MSFSVSESSLTPTLGAGGEPDLLASPAPAEECCAGIQFPATPRSTADDLTLLREPCEALEAN